MERRSWLILIVSEAFSRERGADTRGRFLYSKNGIVLLDEEGGVLKIEDIMKGKMKHLIMIPFWSFKICIVFLLRHCLCYKGKDWVGWNNGYMEILCGRVDREARRKQRIREECFLEKTL